ncbi:hypothetical protein H7F15_18885 [Pontibacter sp. Tf4]|uniref:hypothetical protein n=1 Tax=Pontibacter sp. Tf4 TaxID=2761620 RepID=UPI0016267491|nr:hypothetical protein [Pontibacter sp. Tf4]MBB6613113.1 hypothetical protein [Pontibacter sp. Tf4]
MKQLFTLLIFCLAFSLITESTFAQIKATTDSKHKKEQKRFLKEARKTESTYKETHLNTNTYTYKKGEAARKRAIKRDERRKYKYDDTGKPHKKKQIFRKKATKKQEGV